jgi:hypothetical protein
LIRIAGLFPEAGMSVPANLDRQDKVEDDPPLMLTTKLTPALSWRLLAILAAINWLLWMLFELRARISWRLVPRAGIEPARPVRDPGF